MMVANERNLFLQKLLNPSLIPLKNEIKMDPLWLFCFNFVDIVSGVMIYILGDCVNPVF